MINESTIKQARLNVALAWDIAGYTELGFEFDFEKDLAVSESGFRNLGEPDRSNAINAVQAGESVLLSALPRYEHLLEAIKLNFKNLEK